MGWEDHLPGGVPLTTVEKLAGYARAHSVWPAACGLACCAMELMATAGAQQPTRRPFIGSESQPTRHEHHISRQESS